MKRKTEINKKAVVLLIAGFMVFSTIPVIVDADDENDYVEKRPDLNGIFFDKVVTILMKLAHFPSLSACIIDSNEVVWSKGYGFYDLENEKPSTEHTIHNIGSISKTITGTALMQLYERGFFDLDDDVNDYLPFTLRNPNFPDVPITFRMLLSHSSGLAPEILIDDYHPWYWFNFSDDPPFSFYPYPWIIDYLTPGGKWYDPPFYGYWNPENPPGEYHIYANINFDIVAYLVEILSGESFLDYCNEHILLPLEMCNTSFNLSNLNIDNVAIPYYYSDGEYLTIDTLPGFADSKYHRILHYPVGGLYTTVIDLSHFLIAHMNGGVYKGIRILEKETVMEMHKIQPPDFDDSQTTDYGLAWVEMEYSFCKEKLSGHNGGNFGVWTFMYYPCLYNDTGVIFFVNNLPNTETLFSNVASMILFNILCLKALEI